MSGRWRIEHSRGDAAAFHAHDPPPSRAAAFHDVERPTLVLGSAQREESVDHEVAVALGVDVVRRRSGGGAVLLLPGEFIWLDVVVPTTDVLWSPDVGRAMLWIGEVWRGALADAGVAATVHAGKMVAGQWSPQVCFAGLGTGEVVAAGSGPKLVGVSQRRTRASTRLQTMCHLRWRPELVAALVAAPRPAPSLIAPFAAPVACDPGLLRSLLVEHLGRR